MAHVLRRSVFFLALLALAAAPREAAALVCPSAPQDNLDFLGPCGPSLQLPPWGNGAWSLPEYYTTIQTGDVDGDGAAELIGRSGAGLEVHKFDVVRGLWLPFLDADGQFVLTEFSDKLRPSTTGRAPWAWDEVQYYATIQTGDIDGDGRDEILGRGALGMVVWDYDPTTKSWSELPGGLGFTDHEDFDNPSVYNTIQTADINGNGSAELLARGFGGMFVFSFDGTSWTRIGIDGPFPGEFGDWNNAPYYSTIQTADIDGNGSAELLGRGVDGMRAYSWTGKIWKELNKSGPFTDPFWPHPQYYSTIQTADLDGNGSAELLGRADTGIEVWGWTGSEWTKRADNGPMNDGPDNYDHAEYYTTIQTADLDGDGSAELLGRGAFGIEVFKWTGSPTMPWDRKVFKSPRLDDSYSDNGTIPLWEGPQYYETIQTANIDGLIGSGKAELLARGSFGIRTWRLDTSNATSPVWTRYQPYGYPDPAFPNPDHQAAYEALGTFLLLNPDENDVRLNSANGYGNTSVILDQPLVDFYKTNQVNIADTCELSSMTKEQPPQFGSCTPPSGSGVDAADWTFVANEIIAELFYVREMFDFYEGFKTAQTDAFVTNNLDFMSMAAEFKIGSVKTAEIAEANYLRVFSNITKILATFGGLAGPEIGVPLSVLGSLMGATAAASSLMASHDMTFEDTYASASGKLSTLEQTSQDAIDDHKNFIRGDLGVLTAVGGLVTPPPSMSALWQVNAAGYRSAARYGFAKWVYQTFLPLEWTLIVKVDCVSAGVITCTPPENAGCFPTAIEDSTCYMGTYKDDGKEFSGLFPTTAKNGCVTTSVGTHFTVNCTWINTMGQDIETTIWGENKCDSLDPDWVLGECDLGVPSGPDSDIVNNRNGWDFPRRVSFANTTVQGQVPIAPEGGRLQAAVTVLLANELDLRNVEVSLDRVLHERGGAGELARDRGGNPIDPDSLVPTKAGGKAGRKSAMFKTFPGDEPRMRLKLREHRGQLEAQLHVQRLIARDPALCAGVTPTTDLWTSFTIDDGVNPPTEILALAAWECREKHNKDRELRAR